LLGYVDVILELSQFGHLGTDSCRRKLWAMSRHAETPQELVYEWTPGTPEFREVENPLNTSYLENWETVCALLKSRTVAATQKELLADWPTDQVPPSSRVLYDWLVRALNAKLIERIGSGTRNDPFRYRLPRARSDFFDLSDLPPLEV
jgi:hypothetical protein